jgi:hypothetical protein
VSRRGRTGRDSRGWRGQSRRRRPETPDSHDSTAKTARTEPSEERNNLNDLLTQETEGSAATHRFDRDVLQDPPFRARLDGRLHIAVRETVHGMRGSGVRAAPRFFVGPFGKVGLGRAARFFLLGEKESWRREEVDFGRVEVGEVR